MVSTWWSCRTRGPLPQPPSEPSSSAASRPLEKRRESVKREKRGGEIRPKLSCPHPGGCWVCPPRHSTQRGPRSPPWGRTSDRWDSPRPADPAQGTWTEAVPGLRSHRGPSPRPAPPPPPPFVPDRRRLPLNCSPTGLERSRKSGGPRRSRFSSWRSRLTVHVRLLQRVLSSWTIVLEDHVHVQQLWAFRRRLRRQQTHSC